MGRLSRTCPTCGGKQPAEIRLALPAAHVPGGAPVGLTVSCVTCGHVFPPLDAGPADATPEALDAWLQTRRAARGGAVAAPEEV